MENKITYRDVPRILLTIFPEYRESELYDEEDITTPHVFLVQFYDYMRQRMVDGSLTVGSSQVRAFFELVNDLGNTGQPDDKDFVVTGFIESMESGESADHFLFEAARRYLPKDVYPI